MSEAIQFTKEHENLLFKIPHIEGRLDGVETRLDRVETRLDEHTTILSLHSRKHDEHSANFARVFVFLEDLQTKLNSVIEIMSLSHGHDAKQERMEVTLVDHENRLDALEDFVSKDI